ncbi:type IV pili methyl-accepting chemotaxis transducer N-terminal domain-containing protein [Dechloromonas sp. XY25]|uniref:Type IV pili methyl-accepting chemotaxis transducer N-terminal domain-containing protein n=1 Tax=Dechloromonas hankyongensis TaxID=2908002 RepID=A0ABS9JZ94_9RHOO|nr:type IV pili methyl-accepting chemotaxis transducer N-terminal domain-containing protein [Dechloromonas hankyongensis]MCG2576218.1 type IV pili methyl-accepting chemotaxis transducer N-terminal domain-containing protein [Dechloromonas hankyongensis]
MNVRSNDALRAQRKLLAASQLLGGLPPALLVGLTTASRIVELAANQTLYEAGQPIREAHILFTGSVKRVVDVPGGASRVIEIVQHEQLLGVGEVFGATHYAATCSSITVTQLVAIDIRKLREAVHLNRNLSSRIIAALARRQCATEFDAAGFHYGQTGAQRLLDYLLDQAGERAGLAGETTVLLKASKKVIAARIGMTPESLSRNLRELSDKGVIVVDGRCVHIQNAALLDTVSGDAGQRLSFSRKRKGDARPAGKALPSGVLVNMCGRLRLLSQRMAVAWGSIAAGVAPSRARIKLRQCEKDFIRNLERLDGLGLGAEPSAKLETIKRLWPSYQEAMASEDAADAERIFVLSEEILDAADGLTACAASQAAIPEANYVNTAGRNRMLSQRICKLFLFHDWGKLDGSIAVLSRQTCQEFESNLAELARVAGSQAELGAQLEVVASQWQRFARALCPDPSPAGKAKHARLVLTEGERLLRCVDTAVKLFERLAK